jgi:hypothetical protein
VVPRRVDSSYYQALGSVEDLRGYVASDRFLEDMRRGQKVSKEVLGDTKPSDVHPRDPEDPSS